MIRRSKKSSVRNTETGTKSDGDENHIVNDDEDPELATRSDGEYLESRSKQLGKEKGDPINFRRKPYGLKRKSK